MTLRKILEEIGAFAGSGTTEEDPLYKKKIKDFKKNSLQKEFYPKRKKRETSRVIRQKLF
jgi:hypothetical protein